MIRHVARHVAFQLIPVANQQERCVLSSIFQWLEMADFPRTRKLILSRVSVQRQRPTSRDQVLNRSRGTPFE